MPQLVATPIYTAVIALLAVGLALNVIRNRRSKKISLGDGGKPEVERIIRAHANLVEHAPLALLLLGLYELNGGNLWVLHAGGLCLVLGRLLHAWAFTVKPGPARVLGMVLTFNAYFILAPANIVAALS